MFQPLRDEAVFRRVTVDKFGAVCRPRGPDSAPDAIHDELAGAHRVAPRRRKRAERQAGAKPRARQ